ncbi:serine protease inhibitor serpin [Holotrichia oblita]|uniref:Serine protease inhibitor serpin n=1 Tax=Holotrichia oblita TaxID=644536 RepID=A0ACB9TCI9_HOLOL|nr:serine protease inhibitor serpin [Holotrichia oblita]
MVKCITTTSIFLIVLFVLTECTHIQKSTHNLAIKLYSILGESNENVLFSPLSAHISLILCYQGASGTTRNILQDVLELPIDGVEIAEGYKKMLIDLDESKDELIVAIANNIYLKKNYELKNEFQAIANEYFAANVENIDFTQGRLAANQINNWVTKQTRNKIKDIISESALNEETRLVLVNAIYFKGLWTHPFKIHQTQDKFYVSNLQTVDCEMMRTTGEFIYAEDALLDAKILKMPYMHSNIFFVIILPNSINGLKNVETKILTTGFSMLQKDANLENVEVFLPKFKLETSMDLKQPLQDIGLGNIFGEKANFSQMLNSQMPLTISKVLQKTFIDINENGTEAASATSVIMRVRRSLDLHHHTFLANRPFMFYVIDSASSMLLFLGKLINPNPTAIHDEL